MDRLIAFDVLIAIVDSGGFNRAAARLGMSPAMVSTHLARLEEGLGARLIDRTTRRLALTQQGRRFVEDARAILDAVTQAENAVRRGALGPSGRVLVDAPGAVGLRFVVPAVSALRMRHPDIAIDLSVGDRGTVFRADGFDMLIRIGKPRDGGGWVVPLGSTRFVQVASPAYLARRGMPASPDELIDHDTVLYATVERPIGHRWRFQREGEMRWLRPAGVATFNHGDAIAAAAVAGVGIAQTLEMLVAREIEAGLLVPILAEWNKDREAVQIVIPEDRAVRPAVRAVADFLRDEVDWSGCAMPAPSI